MKKIINYKTSSDAQMRSGIDVLEKEIANIGELTALLGDVSFNVLNRDAVHGVIRYLGYKREDYENEIKRRGQDTPGGQIHDWDGSCMHFDRKGTSRIFTDSLKNADRIRWLIMDMDADEYGYLPGNLIAVYEGRLETVNNGKFDSLDLSVLLERCRQEGIPCRVVKTAEGTLADMQSADVCWPGGKINNPKCTHNFTVPCESCGYFWYEGSRRICHNDSGGKYSPGDTAVVSENGDGVTYCRACGTEILSDGYGNFPDNCPGCCGNLDWREWDADIRPGEDQNEE